MWGGGTGDAGERGEKAWRTKGNRPPSAYSRRAALDGEGREEGGLSTPSAPENVIGLECFFYLSPFED